MKPCLMASSQIIYHESSKYHLTNLIFDSNGEPTFGGVHIFGEIKIETLRFLLCMICVFLVALNEGTPGKRSFSNQVNFLQWGRFSVCTSLAPICLRYLLTKQYRLIKKNASIIYLCCASRRPSRGKGFFRRSQQFASAPRVNRMAFHGDFFRRCVLAIAVHCM